MSPHHQEVESLPASPGDLDMLAREKVKARLQLQKLPAEQAQHQVDRTLYPHLWTFEIADSDWSPSIPSSDGTD